MDQQKFVEDSFSAKADHITSFFLKVQIFLGPFLNTLTHMS